MQDIFKYGNIYSRHVGDIQLNVCLDLILYHTIISTMIVCIFCINTTIVNLTDPNAFPCVKKHLAFMTNRN